MQLYAAQKSSDGISDLVSRQVHADYVYMYPPRQAYRPIDPSIANDLHETIASSLQRFDNLNLYVHVPFCRQICRFCNLYAVGAEHQDVDGYIKAVNVEARRYAELTDRKAISTLYIGGGTPSLLTAKQLELLVTRLLMLFSNHPTELPAETALEVDPATVDAAKLRDIRAAGINRINLGYQSMLQDEVTNIGRRRSESSGLGLLQQALRTGFQNVCVDLIYGLQGQTDENWRTSVTQVASIQPQTICAYPLTLRPFTGYRRRGYADLDGAVLYRRYDIANQVLHASGYRQETHVRWVRDGGGYQQKANHWGMQNILGFGAGARSYLWNVDLRNGYSVRARASTLHNYLTSVDEGRYPITDGYIMSQEERIRKAAILNLISIDRQWFIELLNADPFEFFWHEFQAIQDLGYCEQNTDQFRLTEGGIKYRDLLVQSLFSEAVQARVNDFDYDE